MRIIVNYYKATAASGLIVALLLLAANGFANTWTNTAGGLWTPGTNWPARAITVADVLTEMPRGR